MHVSNMGMQIPKTLFITGAMDGYQNIRVVCEDMQRAQRHGRLMATATESHRSLIGRLGRQHPLI